MPELLTWDSEWWGARIGRSADVADLDAAGFDCLWLLVPGANHDDLHEAELLGAQIMDVRVELDCIPTARPIEARPVKRPDIALLAAIARTAFRGMTRFYADPRLPDDRCDDLYENWLRDSADGWATEILVVGDGRGPAGFVTIHRNDDNASIGLIAIAEHVRERGVGQSLASSAIGWAAQDGAKRMTVVTQGCNVPAQRAFQAAGFRTSQTDVWLHRWQ